MNETTAASVTIAGMVNMDGKYEGNTYHEGGVPQKDVIIIASIKFRAKDYLSLAR